jgi:hypothetical protein
VEDEFCGSCGAVLKDIQIEQLIDVQTSIEETTSVDTEKKRKEYKKSLVR